MDDYQQNIDDNNNLSANSGANSGKSENNGQQDINSRHFLDKRIDKVISEINNLVNVSRTGFKALFENTSQQLENQIEQARSNFENSVEETLENYKQQQGNNWRRQIIDKFSTWLYELTGEEFNAMAGEIDLDNDEQPPDFLAFFSELGSLKQEVRLQAKAAQTLSEKTDTILTTVKQEFTEQGQKLEDTTASLKTQLAQARRGGEDSILMEFIKIRDALRESIETSLTCL